jgi:hypothetical protein
VAEETTMVPAPPIPLWLPAAATLPWYRTSRISAFALTAIALLLAFGGVVACGNSGGDGDSGESTCISGECKLTASDGEDIDTFGFSVAIAGDTIVVGASTDEDGDRSGSAYVYRFDGTDWVAEKMLIASAVEDRDYLGTVAVSGDIAAVYVRFVSSQEYSAYVFRFDGTNWVEDENVIACDADGHDLNSDIDISGDMIAVSQEGKRAVYVFRL